MSESVTIPLRMQTPAGPLQIDVQTTEAKIPVHTVAEGVGTISDALVSTAASLAEQAGRSVTCRRGCDACCRQLVPATPVEAFALLDRLEAMPPEQQATIEARFASAKQAIFEQGLTAQVEEVMAERASREVVAEIATLRIPCPFLEESGCSVYDTRPMACRELLVVSDPVFCTTDKDRVQRIPMLTEMSQVLRSLSASIWEEHPNRMPITWALDWAREQRELSGTVAKGTDLFRGILTLMGRQRGRGVRQRE